MGSAGTADRVRLGRVIGLWGVQGWVKIYSDTRPPDAIFSYRPWYIGDDPNPRNILDWRRQGPRLMVHLEGLDDPDQAARLIEQDILVERDVLPPPESGSFYWSDLIGLDVRNLEGHSFGRVHRLIETGANDVLDVRDEQGESVLIPFVMERFVRRVDLASGRVEVDWPLEWLEP